MRVYEYDKRIQELIEQSEIEHDGEITDEVFAEIEHLMQGRDESLMYWLESIALAYRNVNAEAKAIQAEKLRLAERQSKAEKRAERIKSYLAEIMTRESVDKMTTERGVKLSWRKSTATEVIDGFNDDRFLIPQEPKLDRVALGKALKDGVVVPGARLVERQNVQVK